jgi:NADH:ubiquinone oxidoreductase subunit K
VALTLNHFLILSAILFSIGLVGALTRRHIIIMLICLEIMLNAGNLNLIAFWYYSPNPDLMHGPLFTLFTIAIAATEAALGLALVLAIFRHFKTIDLEQIQDLKE